jgi:hypothetical protein
MEVLVRALAMQQQQQQQQPPLRQQQQRQQQPLQKQQQQQQQHQPLQHQQVQDHQVARAAAVSVWAVAKLRPQQPPAGDLLSQLEGQQRRLLSHCDHASLVQQLLAYALYWRLQPGSDWLAAFYAASEDKVLLLSPQQLRAVGVCLMLLKVRVPGSWLTAYVQATGRAMQAALPGSAGAVNLQGGCQHQQAFSAFLGNAAFALAKLGVAPNHAWQLLWRQHVAVHLPSMTANQLLDALWAAAVWSHQSDNTALMPAAVFSPAASLSATATAVPAAAAAAAAPPPSSHPDRLPSAVAAFQGALKPSSSVNSHQQGGLPVLRRPEAVPGSSSSSSSGGGGAAAALKSGSRRTELPPVSESWVQALLEQLWPHLPVCDCGMLAKSLWCLRRLQLKAPIAWLDAVYDAALLQVNQASMPQLLQLLHGLQHQDFELAPARLDLMLQAASAQLLSSFAGSGGGGSSTCTPQQLMQVVELVVLLGHEPTPEWCNQVGRAAQNMLQQQTWYASTRGDGLSAWLLARLLDCWAQLDVPLTEGAQVAFRVLVKRQLPYFGQQSLPRLLSAIATRQHRQLLRRQSLQLLLVHMRRQLQDANAEALGLAGVSIGQLGLRMSGTWTNSFMQRVKALAGTPVAVQDAGNLQRAVQYLSWCKRRAAACRRRNCSNMRLRFRCKMGRSKHDVRFLLPGLKRARRHPN